MLSIEKNQAGKYEIKYNRYVLKTIINPEEKDLVIKELLDKIKLNWFRGYRGKLFIQDDKIRCMLINNKEEYVESFEVKNYYEIENEFKIKVRKCQK